MAILPNNFDPGLLPRPTWKLRAAAVLLAALGGFGSLWLALDGQKVKMQEVVYGERQALLARLADESSALQTRIEERRTQATAAEDRLAHARRGLAEVEAARASAASARDQLEADRLSAAIAGTALLKAAETEQRKLEQLKAETTAARWSLKRPPRRPAASIRNANS